MSKFHASMKQQTAEMLTSRSVRLWIKKQVAAQNITEANLDADDLAEEAEDVPPLDVDGLLDMT